MYNYVHILKVIHITNGQLTMYIPYTGKLSRFEWEMAIHGNFAIVFLIYIADRQGHDSQEKIHD